MISPGSERPERLLLGERRNWKRLEDHANHPNLQLGGKIRGKEADHTQTRHLLGWKWNMCWGIFPYPKLGGALQMELGWVYIGVLCSSQKKGEVRQEWLRCV